MREGGIIDRCLFAVASFSHLSIDILENLPYLVCSVLRTSSTSQNEGVSYS